MRLSSPEEVRSDVVIVGAGVAGLMSALHVAGRSVLLLADTPPGMGGSSPAAQGGVAAAVAEGDSPELHARDTLAVGGGVNDPDVVRLVTREGPERVREIAALGAALDRRPDGRLALGREGGHRRRRVAHAAGDATGAELVRAMAAAVADNDNIQVRIGLQLEGLLLEGDRCAGILARDGGGRTLAVSAPAVVLATGGIGRLYRHTTNPAPGNGAGLAVAAAAGARLADLEMVQFHPTALAGAADPMGLLTEALRGEGAMLVDDSGQPLMEGVHPDGDLAPRDIVSRVIWRKLALGRRVFLDARSLGESLAARFPTVLGLCLEQGIDPHRQPMPVAPAAHYHMGGVLVDTRGRSSLPGLWACGELACTGLHGANRLASNSLLEALVYGARVGDDISGAILPVPSGRRAAMAAAATQGASVADPATSGWVIGEVRRLMWTLVGLERSDAGLEAALASLDRLSAVPSELSTPARRMLRVAQLIARSARARAASCGAHFRSDGPQEVEAVRYRLVVEGDGRLWRVPVVAAHPMVRTGMEVS